MELRSRTCVWFESKMPEMRWRHLSLIDSCISAHVVVIDCELSEVQKREEKDKRD
ncbi:unnamed protein product [Sphenostylis stenocarpa]|uniref:Uncharacterized protein n=1 Tax=Sphenostylis stenocarpa TaxID=92480 RepID=A0AA86VTL6_9FABA|nr:unnamed protein product [Sphenostylis stenocarpa]